MLLCFITTIVSAWNTYAQTPSARIQGEKGEKGLPGINGALYPPPSDGKKGADGICNTSSCFANVIPYALHPTHITQNSVQVSDFIHTLPNINNAVFVCTLEDHALKPPCDVYQESQASSFIHYLSNTLLEDLKTQKTIILSKGNIKPILQHRNATGNTVESLLLYYRSSEEISDMMNSSSLILWIDTTNTFSQISHTPNIPLNMQGILFQPSITTSGILNTTPTRATHYLKDIDRTSHNPCQNGDIMVLNNQSWICGTTDTVQQSHIYANTLKSEKIALDTVSLDDFKSNAVFNTVYFLNGTVQSNDILVNSLTNTIFSPLSIKNQHFIVANMQSEDIKNDTFTAHILAPGNIVSNHITDNAVLSLHIANFAIQERHISSLSLTARTVSQNTVHESKLHSNGITDPFKISPNMAFETFIETPSSLVLTNGSILFQNPSFNAQISTQTTVAIHNFIAHNIVSNQTPFNCTGCIGSNHIRAGSISYTHIEPKAKIPPGFCFFSLQSTCPSGLTPKTPTGKHLLRFESTPSNTAGAPTNTTTLTHTAHNHQWGSISEGVHGFINLCTGYSNGVCVEQQAIDVDNSDKLTSSAGGSSDVTEYTDSRTLNIFTNTATESAHTLTVTSTNHFPAALGITVCCRPD